MKRKVGLFLLAVMVAVTLGATVVASLAMYRLVSAKQAQEIRRIETSLSERFAIFETMLRSRARPDQGAYGEGAAGDRRRLRAPRPRARGPVGRRARRARQRNTASSTSTSSTARTRCSRPTWRAT